LEGRLFGRNGGLDGEAIWWRCPQLGEGDAKKLESCLIGIVVSPVGADRDHCLAGLSLGHLASVSVVGGGSDESSRHP
jgi:hypothetical protein